MSVKLDLHFFNHNRNYPLGRLVRYKDETCETIFSDFEAFSLCVGFDDEKGYLMKIARGFFLHNRYTDKEIFEAHRACMNASQIYDYEFLKTLLQLPQLTFESPFRTKEIFSLFDENLNEIRIVCYKEFKTSEYYNTFVIGPSDRNQNELTVELISDTHRNIREPVMNILRDDKIQITGLFSSIEIVQNIIPVINLLTKYHEDPSKMIVYYGLATSYCSVCNRPLSDPISIERGIGPVCAGRVGVQY